MNSFPISYTKQNAWLDVMATNDVSLKYDPFETQERSDSKRKFPDLFNFVNDIYNHIFTKENI